MDESAARVRKLLRQQAAIASFGSFALREGDLLKVLTEAARVCAEGLDVRFSKVCRYREVEKDLLIEAGFGWNKGVIGHFVSRADPSSPQGRAFVTGEPSICRDLGQDSGFVLPPFYAAHGIVSTIDVVIKGNDDRPYGILEIDSDQQHDFDQNDINFLTGFANVLAEAVATSVRTEKLQATLASMKTLLDQKQTLAEELQHRVRNNLQLVYGLLSRQLTGTKDEAAQKEIKAIARRVSTLAQVYDNLLGTGMERTTDIATYLKSLCLNLAAFQSQSGGAITLDCDCDTLLLDLDTVTALGIVVAELVTNCYDHAFNGSEGAITVVMRRLDGDQTMMTLTVTDNGAGFKPNAGANRHGLGLVKRLVQQLRGTVDVSSGKGTAWTIRFPIPAL